MTRRTYLIISALALVMGSMLILSIYSPDFVSAQFSPTPEPDGDGDGVPDYADRCPTLPGPPTNYGCPPPTQDTDDDGVPDVEDRCPFQYGPLENGGCPLQDHDTDGDGVPDNRDNCVAIPGPASHDGCPIITSEPTRTSPPPIRTPDIPDDSQCRTATDGLSAVNIRATPNLDAPVVGSLDPRYSYLILSSADGEGGLWYEVGGGWVASWVIRVGGQCGSLRFPDPDLPSDEPGEDLPDEEWTGISVEPATCPNYILYHTNAGNGNWNIFGLKLDDDTFNVSRDENYQNIQPSYSDDGKWIVFTSDRADDNWEIYVTAAEDEDADILRMTFNTGVDINPVWGPSNLGIIFESNRDARWKLYLFDVAESGLANALDRALTSGEGNDVNAYWSPDGEIVYFQSDRDGDWEIFAVDVESGELTQLTHNEVDDVDPVASSDGKWLAWRQQNSEGIFDLWLLDLATGETRQLTNTGQNVRGPQFANSSAFIAFHMEQENNLEIFAVSVDGDSTILKQVTSNAGINDLSAVFRCGTDLILYHSNANYQNDIYEVDPLPLDGGVNEPNRLTNTDDADEIYPLGDPRTENNSREGRLP